MHKFKTDLMLKTLTNGCVAKKKNRKSKKNNGFVVKYSNLNHEFVKKYSKFCQYSNGFVAKYSN